MKKHILLFLSLSLLLSYQSKGQHNNFELPTSINETGAAPHRSAILDLQSPDKGLLIPRMNMAARDLITEPATGLMIYQLDNSPGFYYFEGGDWKVVDAHNASIMLNGTTLEVTDGGGTLYTDLSELRLTEVEVDDMVSNNGYLSTEMDGDPGNEIQDLNLAGNMLTITNNGAATSIDLSAYLDNTDTQLTEAEVDDMVSNNGYLSTEMDGDPGNEIQDLNLVGNMLTITNNGAATIIDLKSYLDNTDTQLTEMEVDDMVSNNGYLSTEMDGDPGNEIQDLNLVGNMLTITNNGAATIIDLKSYLDNTDTQLTEAQVDSMVSNNSYLTTEMDGDVTNEIQDLNLVGNILTITNNGAATIIDLSGYLDNTDTQLTEVEVDSMVSNNGYLTTEMDGDVTNEIQDLNLVGNMLTITNNGAATIIDLSGYLDNTDTQLTEVEVDSMVSNNGYLELPQSPISGEMSYWDGSAWVSVAPGETGQTLNYCYGVPIWGPCPPSDVDGNIYETITIGTQEWLTTDLRTTKCNDGTPIPIVTDSAAWVNLSTAGYSWYNNDSTVQTTNGYGALYNWYAADTSYCNICPTGWHVPTDAEWTILIDYLDPGDVDPAVYGAQSTVSGGKMKEAGLAHWNSPNTGATGESGWSGLPGGFRYTLETFKDFGYNGYWWSSTESGVNAWIRSLKTWSGNANRVRYGKREGLSVRCLRD